MFCKRLYRYMLLCALCLSGATQMAHAQRGALVQPRNLVQLVDQSALIVRGRIVSAVVQPHPQLTNLSTVVVTLKVDKSLKGSTNGRYTFRSFIWDLRDKQDAAGYRKGNEVLLLLNPTTEYGLQSTAGLDQGRFTVVRDTQGNATVANGSGNAMLFRDLAETAAKRGVKFSARANTALAGKPGALTLGALEDMITALAGGH